MEEKGELREKREKRNGENKQRQREKGREDKSGEIEILIDRYIDRHLEKQTNLSVYLER